MTQRTRLLLGPRQMANLLNALTWAIDSWPNPDVDTAEERAVVRDWVQLREQVATAYARANVKARKPFVPYQSLLTERDFYE